MARDGDAEHLTLDASIEALDHTVGARGVGLGLAMLDAEIPAGLFKAVGGEAAAAVGQHVRDVEGKDLERLLEEGPGTGFSLVVLDRQMHGARASVDRHEQVALAALAIRGPQLGQVLDVDVDEAELVFLELARCLRRRGRCRPAAQTRRFEDAIDVVAVEMGQEVADHEGEVVEREAGGATQLTDDGALLFAGLPGQLVGPGRTVETVAGSAFAPLANGLSTDAKAPGENARAFARAGDLGTHSRGGTGVGMDREHGWTLALVSGAVGGGDDGHRSARLQPLKAPTVLLDHPMH